MVNLREGPFVVGREDRDVSQYGKDPADWPATPKEDEGMNFWDIAPEKGDEGDSEDGDEKKTVDGWCFRVAKASKVIRANIHVAIENICQTNEGDAHRSHFHGF